MKDRNDTMAPQPQTRDLAPHLARPVARTVLLSGHELDASGADVSFLPAGHTRVVTTA